jgi:hypothetical protein
MTKETDNEKKIRKDQEKREKNAKKELEKAKKELKKEQRNRLLVENFRKNGIL